MWSAFVFFHGERRHRKLYHEKMLDVFFFFTVWVHNSSLSACLSVLVDYNHLVLINSAAALSEGKFLSPPWCWEPLFKWEWWMNSRHPLILLHKHSPPSWLPSMSHLHHLLRLPWQCLAGRTLASAIRCPHKYDSSRTTATRPFPFHNISSKHLFDCITVKGSSCYDNGPAPFQRCWVKILKRRKVRLYEIELDMQCRKKLHGMANHRMSSS